MREVLRTRLNLEMANTPEIVEIALQLKPDIICLVPERREEVSTEGGLDVIAREARIKDLIAELAAAGVLTSLFIDPEPAQIAAAERAGAAFVELHTGAFANAWGTTAFAGETLRIAAAAEEAYRAGLTVNLGHGINYSNITHLRDISGIHEMNIGHSILARSLFTGIREAVREMKRLMNGGLPG